MLEQGQNAQDLGVRNAELVWTTCAEDCKRLVRVFCDQASQNSYGI
jgi:hypothetical protein